MPTNFDQSSIPRYGWSKPTIVHIPSAYQQVVGRVQPSDDPFISAAMNVIPPPGVSPYDDYSKQDGNQTFASDHRYQSQWSAGRSLTHPKPSPNADRDEVRSEWETIAGDDELDNQTPSPPKAKVTLKSLGLVPENDCNSDDDAGGKRGKKAFARPGTPFDAFGFSTQPGVHEARPIGMDMEASYSPFLAHNEHTGFVRQPVHGGAIQRAGSSRAPAGPRSFPINSKTSSSESTDRFKYDGEAYSTFLQPSNTRETKKSMRRPATTSDDKAGFVSRARAEPRGPAKVDNEVRIPVAGGQRTRYQLSTEYDPEPAAAEDDERWQRVRTDAGTDADWQTVTTGPVCRNPNSSEVNLIKGTGSSLADVSDIMESYAYPVEQYRTPGTISHQRNRSVRHPEGFFIEDYVRTYPRVIHEHGASNVDQRQQRAFHETAQHATRAARAAAAVRRLSDPFQTPPNWKSDARVIELEDDDNEAPDTGKGVQAQANTLALTRTDSTETVWPRVIRHNETVNEFDQAFCETRIEDTTIPSDDSANVFSRLPFDLIDLKEAAKCYGSQRDRSAAGANSFAERARLGPLWSGYSNEAGSSSSGAYRYGGAGNSPVTRPSTAVFRDQIAHSHPTVEFDFIDNTPAPSSAILGSLRSRSFLRSNSGTPRFGHFRAAAALGAKCLRIKAPPPESENSQPWAFPRNQTGGVLTPSEAELIESARGEIMDRRRSPEQAEHKRKILFISIILLSIVFPLIGLLALVGKFDSTVCWYALGEMQGFTKEQRGMLMQQLLVETFIYTLLIIFLSLHFSGHI
ncbi:hypothetical protein TARUN_10137 [Trichoderma arundinaceum]|uniref:Uncharacterized protein n=1 Tax=Trichoderma arundinaceum TaxID=490622 RepID=A0A395N8B3_TRIAR|nr:hypothetical protein TARUN_10137 [Trichoderma arundinaceum]